MEDLQFWPQFDWVIFLKYIPLIFGFVFSIILLSRNFTKGNKVIENHLFGCLNKAKSKLAKDHFYSLISIHRSMKNYVGAAIMLLTIFVIIAGVLIFVDSRDYFKKYFANQRDKIELASQASVDSLKATIDLKNKTIDSLRTVSTTSNQAMNEKLIMLEKNEKSLRKENTNLQNVINHQNQMILSMRK